jgi:hypothetical protein
MRGQLGAAQRPKLDPLQPWKPEQLDQQRSQRVPTRESIGPVAANHHHPAAPKSPSKKRQQLTCGLIGPMQVLQHEHHR